jgi:hypothetical protein
MDVIPTTLGVGHGLSIGKGLFIVNYPLGGETCTSKDDVFDRRQTGIEGREQGLQALINDHNVSAGIVKYIDDFCGGKTDIQGHHDAPGPGDCKERFQIAVAVEGKDSDAASRTEIESLQDTSQFGHALGELTPRTLPCGVDGGDAVTVDLHRTFECLGHGHRVALL